jgi:hypothetical protein
VSGPGRRAAPGVCRRGAQGGWLGRCLGAASGGVVGWLRVRERRGRKAEG